ncbi:MAG: hypothetical protein UHM08_02290 [Bacteroidales bacterium]|jgi:hypothetical protein|nr:hypothetical protein [Bacteroidales bacterium]
MQLHAILKNNVVFTTNDGKIINEQLSEGAKMVLEWYNKNIPANQK